MLSAALEREFSNEVTLTMNRIKQRIPAIVQYCQSRIDQSESSEAVSDDPFIDPAYRKEQCRNDRSRRGRNNPNTNETPSTPRTPRTRRNESKRSSHALPKAKPTLETQALIQEMESSASMSGAFTDPILTPAESSATHTSLYDSSLTPSWNPTINQQSAETFDTGQSDFSALQQTPSLTPNPSDAWTSTCSYESESIPSQSFFPPTNPFSQQFDPNNIMGEDDCTVQQNTLQCTFTNFPQPIAPHFGRQSQQPYNAESWNSFHQNMNTSNFPQSSNANHIGGWASSNTYPLNTRTDQHSYTVQSLDDRAGAYIDQDEVSLSNNVQHNPFLRNRDAGTRDQQGRQIPERTKRSGNRAEAEMDSYFHFPES